MEGDLGASEWGWLGLGHGEDGDYTSQGQPGLMGHAEGPGSLPRAKPGLCWMLGRQWLQRVTSVLLTGSPTVLPSRPSDEHHPEVKADGYVDNLAEAVDLLLQHTDK